MCAQIQNQHLSHSLSQLSHEYVLCRTASTIYTNLDGTNPDLDANFAFDSGDASLADQKKHSESACH